jgi:phage N-6-adenine-methyltransferase
MLHRSLFTSRTDEWTTPKDLFEALNARFHFNLDPCATSRNTTCERYFTKSHDGLKQTWTGRVFMNPPYGRHIGKWVKKAYEESRSNAELVVCLLPARTDTRWWHDYCMRGEIAFIKGRVKFSDAKTSAPFPSAIVGFWSAARLRTRPGLKCKGAAILSPSTHSNRVTDYLGNFQPVIDQGLHVYARQS